MIKMALEEIKEIMQLNHPEKFLAFFLGMSEQTAADIYGIDIEIYIEIKREFQNNAKEAADVLLKDSKFVEQIKKLPFKKGQTILGFGDSITDDYQSWFEILTHLVDKVFGEKYFNMVNAGISGDTSLMLIKRFVGVVNEKPDWIICMVGTNDSIRNKLLPTRTNITFEETKKNLDYLVKLSQKKINSEWIWITPPNINVEKIDAHPITELLQNTWNKEDVRSIAEYMKSRNEKTVDLWKVFGDPVNDEYLMYDGLHPSLEGHKAIVKELVKSLGMYSK
jgi:acyl-CoA thioesterase I